MSTTAWASRGEGDETTVCQVHPGSKTGESGKHRVEFVAQDGHDVHALEEPVQRSQGGGIIVEEMCRLRGDGFAGEQAPGQFRQGRPGPAVVGITRVDRSDERAGINHYDAS